jgi:hypothetical protein
VFGASSIAAALFIMMLLLLFMAVLGLMGHEQKPEAPPILEGIKCEQTVSKGPDLSEAIRLPSPPAQSAMPPLFLHRS